MIARLVAVEARRLVGRRLIKLLLALPLLPIVISLLLRGRLAPVFDALRSMGARTDLLWLAMLGSEKAMAAVTGNGGMGVGSVAGLAVANLASYAWLVAILFAVYTFAHDVSNGRLALLASRPVPRWLVAVAKASASALVLVLLYFEAAIAAYVSAWLLAGGQSEAWLIPVYAVLMTAASLPMLLLTGLAGLKLGRGGSTLAVGLAAYFLLSMLPLFASIVYIRSGSFSNAESVMAYVNALEPIHSFLLPRLVADAVVAGLHAEYTFGFGAGGTMPTVGTMLALNAASTIAAIVALGYLTAWYLGRLDIKVP